MEEFSKVAGWRMQPKDKDCGAWEIQLQHGPESSRSRLLKIEKMADRANVDSPGTFSRLRSLPPHDIHASNPEIQTLVQTELNRLGAEPPTLGAALYQASLVTNCSLEPQLADNIRNVMKGMLLPVLQRASTWLLTVNSALTSRFAITRVLLQVEDDPEILQRTPQDFAGFRSAHGLFSDTLLGLSAYISPLLTSISPYIWGFTAPRIGGVIIYNLAQPVPGRVGHTAEPLQLFHPSGFISSPPMPDIQPQDFEAALKWWISKLNRLFYEVTDPCNYSSPDGEFEVRRQFESILSLEQAFRNVQSVSADQRDGHSRRLACLDTLDTLEGMSISSFKDMCTASYAQATLRQLEGEMPAQVANVLLPRAARSVDALISLQSGFFLPSRKTADGIRLPDKNHGERVLTYEEAVAAWLRVLRNAGHAFSSKKPGTRLRDQALLMAHDGIVPHDFSDLAYLYLLRLIANPESSLSTRRRPQTRIRTL